MFRIEIVSKYWINNSTDDPEDRCLHGDVKALVGEETFETSCTISAMALRLLKTLNEDHNIPNCEEQMLPCCGFFIIPNETLDNVVVTGCPNGIDWIVKHENGKIKIQTQGGKETMISFEEYKKEVFRIADEVEDYYNSCNPKIIEDEFDKDGYIAFWNEWHRRRESFV